MKFPYISVSACKAVKIKGAQIIIGEASPIRKYVTLFGVCCMMVQNCTNC